MGSGASNENDLYFPDRTPCFDAYSNFDSNSAHRPSTSPSRVPAPPRRARSAQAAPIARRPPEPKAFIACDIVAQMKRDGHSPCRRVRCSARRTKGKLTAWHVVIAHKFERLYSPRLVVDAHMQIFDAAWPSVEAALLE